MSHESEINIYGVTRTDLDRRQELNGQVNWAGSKNKSRFSRGKLGDKSVFNLGSG